jgi:4-diphosphocytidyl-2-C-methyl-D-erythritol kinase
VRELAPAKINLCLYLGPIRDDGRHELVTVMEPLELADVVTLDTGARADEIVCPGVEGPNLAARALAAFRATTGWDGPPVTITIDKRIPIAGGMAGGSADAAAALRLVSRASGIEDDALLHDLAAQLGSDVPAQVRPRRVLATGAGEQLAVLDPPERPYGVLVLPSHERLATGAVYAEADRLGLPRPTLVDVDVTKRTNDLEPAARSLCPAIDEALAQAREAGAEHAMVSGSGPTVIGLFATPDDAERAAQQLAHRDPAPIVTTPLEP